MSQTRQLHWKLDQLLTHQWQKRSRSSKSSPTSQTDFTEKLVHKPPRGPAPAAER